MLNLFVFNVKVDIIRFYKCKTDNITEKYITKNASPSSCLRSPFVLPSLRSRIKRRENEGTVDFGQWYMILTWLLGQHRFLLLRPVSWLLIS